MKKIPQRMCISCRTRQNKRDLIRVVYKSGDEDISVDPSGKKPGRGAYICKNRNCLEQAMKNNRFERGLHTKIPTDKVEELWREIASSLEPDTQEGILSQKEGS